MVNYSLWSMVFCMWCFMRIKRSWILNFFIKFIMLLLAFWMIGDQVSDILQSIKYFVFSMFWNEDWHQQDQTNLTLANGTNGIQPCQEATLAECWDYIHITMANDTVDERVEFEKKCGTWNKTTKTIELNCKLRLNWAYFACSLACWLLPPVAFGSLLTCMKYKVSKCIGILN